MPSAARDDWVGEHQGVSMTLLEAVVKALQRLGTPFALIGGQAVSVRGFPRMTLDFDFLSADDRVLARPTWEALSHEGIRVDIRRGDAFDPIAGVAHFEADEARVDVLLAKWKWEAALLSRAEPLDLGAVVVPVATTSDLILLKLAAGGPIDLQDVYALLELGGDSVAREVDRRVSEVHPDVTEVWARVKASMA